MLKALSLATPQNNNSLHSKKQPLENFQEVLFILLLLVGRNRSRTGPFLGSQQFCLAEENKRLAVRATFLVAEGRARIRHKEAGRFRGETNAIMSSFNLVENDSFKNKDVTLNFFLDGIFSRRRC